MLQTIFEQLPVVSTAYSRMWNEYASSQQISYNITWFESILAPRGIGS